MKRKIVLSMAMLAVLLFAGCVGGSDADSHMENWRSSLKHQTV